MGHDQKREMGHHVHLRDMAPLGLQLKIIMLQHLPIQLPAQRPRISSYLPSPIQHNKALLTSVDPAHPVSETRSGKGQKPIHN